jgi:ribonuclease R
MAEEGLIDGKRTAYHRMGGVPKVTVLRVIGIEDGLPVAGPTGGSLMTPAPAAPDRGGTARGAEKGPQMRGVGALKPGDACSAAPRKPPKAGGTSHEEAALRPKASWAWSRLTARARAGWPRSTSVSAMPRPSADLGGAVEGQLVMAEPAGRAPAPVCG